MPDTDENATTMKLKPTDGVTTPAPTRGIYTTEYWLSKAAMVIGALLTAGVFGSGTPAERIAGAAVAVLAALGYTYSRTLVKGA